MARRKGRATTETIGIAPVQFPTASLLPFAGASAPDNWLLCAGQAVSRSTYAALFSIIGTTYGVGDGSTTFNLPDLRGRVPAGKDDMGGSPANRLTSGGSGINGVALGAAGGTQTHTLSTTEMPSHTHTQNAHTHTQTAHNHAVGRGSGNSTLNVYNNGMASTPNSVADLDSTNFIKNRTAVNQNTTATNQNTGGGLAHNNTQPSLILNYIIKI